MKIIFKLFLFLSLLCSCVSNKDSVFLQGVPEKNVNFQHKTYRTQVNDILIINVTTSKPELLSFFNNLGNNQARGNSNNTQNVNPYFLGYRVDPNGNIRLPYIGELYVVGHSIVEIREKIEHKLSKFIKNKNSFYVDVKQGGIKYTILGEISNPGTQILFQYEANIIDAIANSGDVTEYANRKSVEIIRQEQDGIKKYEVDLTQIDILKSNVFLIKNNDIINIRPLKQKPTGLGTTGLGIFNTIISTFTVAITTILFIRSL